jgi:uncharacterized membrane protein YhaH (DUF805 family)
MSFTQAVRSGFANYANFHGRASRPAYWWWALFAFIASNLARWLDKVLGLGPKPSTPFALLGWGLLSTIVTLGLLLPSWAVFVRRLHDTNRTGWWYLLTLIPAIGTVLLGVVFLGGGGTSLDMRGWVLLFLLMFLFLLVGVAVQIYFLASSGTPGVNRYGPPPPGTAGDRYTHMDALPSAPDARLKGGPGDG